MSRKKVALYWKGMAETREDLLRGLEVRGLEVKSCRSLEEVLDEVVRRDIELLVVDASAGEREASSRVVELSSTARLYGLATVFLATAAAKRTIVLKSDFERFAAIDIPFKVNAALSVITALLSGSPEGDLLENEPHVVKSLANVIELDPLATKDGYGGRVFAQARAAYFFNDELLLPKERAAYVCRRALEEFADKDEWSAVHARRVVHLATTIAAKLGFTEPREQNVRIVGFLLNLGLLDDWGLLENFRLLRRYDFLLDPSRERIDKVARGIERSAERCKMELRDARAERGIITAGKLLQQKAFEEDSELIEEAQCAMMSELADRACWSHGIWNPSGAHRVIRHLRSKDNLDITKRVADAFIAAMGEAVSTYREMVLANDPYAFSGGAGGLESVSPKVGGSRMNRLAPPKPEVPTRTLAICELTPGMRLAKPLSCDDGTVILETDIVLDLETIHRLWQLSSIRTVADAVIVKAAAA